MKVVIALAATFVVGVWGGELGNITPANDTAPPPANDTAPGDTPPGNSTIAAPGANSTTAASAGTTTAASAGTTTAASAGTTTAANSSSNSSNDTTIAPNSTTIAASTTTAASTTAAGTAGTASTTAASTAAGSANNATVQDGFVKIASEVKMEFAEELSEDQLKSVSEAFCSIAKTNAAKAGGAVTTCAVTKDSRRRNLLAGVSYTGKVSITVSEAQADKVKETVSSSDFLDEVVSNEAIKTANGGKAISKPTVTNTVTGPDGKPLPTTKAPAKEFSGASSVAFGAGMVLALFL